MAAGDFNGDHHVDVIVANFGLDNVGVFLGYGNNSFTSQRTYSTGDGSAPRMVAVGDLNNDTRLDIVVANFGTNNIMIFSGNGNGSFTNQTIIETSPAHPLYVVIGDFNNDKYSDIAFAGYGTNTIDVLLGFGNGPFRAHMSLFTGYDSLPYALGLGDFNEDGQLDIATVNYGTDNIGLFFGYGDGTFHSQTTLNTDANSGPYSMAIFDLNNDTHLDIAVVYLNTDYVGLLYGYGNGSFVESKLYSIYSDSKTISIAIADFNNDNKPDIIILNNGTNTIILLSGYGDGTFTNPVAYSTGPHSSPYSIGVGDFNNDNQSDVVIANQQNNNIKIFNSYAKPTFATEITFSTVIDDSDDDNDADIVVVHSDANKWIDDGAIPSTQNTKHIRSKRTSFGTYSCAMRVAVGDFNNDRLSDIVINNPYMDSIGVLLGYGNGRFASPLVLPVVDSSNRNSIALGDFNNDTWLDIAVANFDTNNIGIFLGHSNGKFAFQLTYHSNNINRPVSLAIGDYNNDGRLDIFVISDGSESIVALLGYGNGTFSRRTIYYAAKYCTPFSIAVADFNNDGRLDIAVTLLSVDNVNILLGRSNGTFQSPKTFSTGTFTRPNSLAVGDFNQDGNMDIAVGNTEGREEHILILLGNGKRNFSNHGKYATQTDSMVCSVVIGNFSKDSHADIAVVSFDSQQVEIFLGYGDGSFMNQMPYSTATSSNPVSIAIGHFNNDNLTDLAVSYFEEAVVGILLGSTVTNFVDQSTWSTGTAASPRSLVLNDFTNDGQFDIIVGNDGTHDIDILINDGYGKFSIQTVCSGDSTFYPTCMVASDFNGDKQLDIAVANSVVSTITLLYGEGNSTFGRPTVFLTEDNSNPQSIAIGDFNNDNKTDIVVAHSNTGSVSFFLRIDKGAVENFTSLSTGSNSKPHKLIVADLDNDGRLDMAVANNGKENVGLFFGVGDGTFTEQKPILIGEGLLPVWVGFGDFNNDKQLDLVVCINVGSIPVIVLLNNGDRSFRLEKTDSVTITI